jgi:hypothetical protein
MSALTLGTLTTMCLAAGACSSQPETTASSDQALSRAFEASAQHHAVPRDLMVAIAVTEHGLEVAAKRDVSPEVEIPSAGPMQLRHGRLDTLARAATLLHTTELELRKDADLALEGGAAVLAELAAKSGAQAGDLASWQSAMG